jgi:hypothetical protein
MISQLCLYLGVFIDCMFFITAISILRELDFKQITCDRQDFRIGCYPKIEPIY